MLSAPIRQPVLRPGWAAEAKDGFRALVSADAARWCCAPGAAARWAPRSRNPSFASAAQPGRRTGWRMGALS
ncbi:hypothetical protein AB0937_37875, partial [Streptomyces sp. NPDC047880]